MKNYLTLTLFFLTYLYGGEISISISEDLVNEYISIIGELVTKKKNKMNRIQKPKIIIGAK